MKLLPRSLECTAPASTTRWGCKSAQDRSTRVGITEAREEKGNYRTFCDQAERAGVGIGGQLQRR
jgi:hypothetical protein